MIYLDQRDLSILQEILAKFPYTFYAFGSRVHGTQQLFSDLDLCVMVDIPELTKSYLEEALEESNLSVKVDIIEWNKISKEFQDLIRHDLVPVSGQGKNYATG